MTQRIEFTNVSGLDVHRQERHSECSAIGQRSMFADLLLWQRITDAESSVGSEAKGSCLSRVFRLAKQRRSELVFAACCLLVVAVSVHDAMLVFLNADIIGEVERNPVGRWLIDLQGGEIWLFMAMKLVGTAVVCTVLVTLYELRARLALVVGGGVASCQLVLLWYLTFGTA